MSTAHVHMPHLHFRPRAHAPSRAPTAPRVHAGDSVLVAILVCVAVTATLALLAYATSDKTPPSAVPGERAVPVRVPPLIHERPAIAPAGAVAGAVAGAAAVPKPESLAARRQALAAARAAAAAAAVPKPETGAVLRHAAASHAKRGE